jgi:TetR/AcrR family transcriptional repressor of lmrAB and yxaGH operons
MVATAMRLICQNGYTATSWRRLVEEAGTPWGSAYHHFPGGKEQLAVAAVELGVERSSEVVRKAFAENDSTEDAIRALFRHAGQVLVKGDFRMGSPLATITLETAHISPVLTEACRQGFQAWHQLLVGLLAERGYPDPPGLAVAIVTNMEGALVLCRIHRRLDALDRAADHVALLAAQSADPMA